MTAESNARSLRDEALRDGDPAAGAEPWLTEQIAFLDLEEGLAG